MSRSQPSIDALDYERHADWLRGLARSLVGDASAADDIAQETWLSALRHSPSQGESLRPWLRRVAQNAAGKLYRSEGRRRDRERLNAPAEEAVMSAAELSESADLIHTLMGEVRGLSEPYRSTVLQSYLQGMTSAEIAEQTGIAEGTVRWRLSAARDELRERMDRQVGSRAGWAVLATPMGFSTRLAAVKTGAAAARTGLTSSWVIPAVLLFSFLGVGAALVNLPETDATLEAPLVSGESVDRPSSVLAAAPTTEQRRTAIPTAMVSELSSKVAAAAEPRFALDLGQASLRLGVEDAMGQPVKGVKFTWKGHPDVRVWTNEDGFASLIFRPPVTGSGVEFLLERDGLVPQVRIVRPVVGRTMDVGTIRMEKALVRSGTVLLAGGGRLPGRTMVFAAPVDEENASAFFPKRARGAPRTWPNVYQRPVAARGSGAFVLTGLPAEPMRLWADCEGMWYSASDVVEPDDEGDVEIVLHPLPEQEAISGRVLGLDGQPAADVLVRLRSQGPNGGTFTAVTDGEGRFRFQPRAIEAYELLGEDLLDRWQDTEWTRVDLGDDSAILRFEKPLR